MTGERLTTLLVQRVMGWTVGPDRFLMGKRSWLPRWRFTPFSSLDHAFSLLVKAGGAYTLSTDDDGMFHAEVHVGDKIGKASGEPKAQTITLALARALGIEVTDDAL